MRQAAFTVVALLTARVCGAQAVQPVTVDPSAAQHTMVRAAGMPLNDGALPPGMLTVRVVRGAFTADLRGQTVVVEIAGGTTESAPTGPDGRAQFAHLPVGARVRVSALVEDQQLISDTFVLPAESGVRVLLVVDGDSSAPPTTVGGFAPIQASPKTTTVTSPEAGPSSTLGGRPTGVIALRVFFTIATLAAFAFVLFRQSTPRRRSPDQSA